MGTEGKPQRTASRLAREVPELAGDVAGGRRADLSGAADRVLGRAAGVRCIDVITE